MVVCADGSEAVNRWDKIVDFFYERFPAQLRKMVNQATAFYNLGAVCNHWAELPPQQC